LFKLDAVDYPAPYGVNKSSDKKSGLFCCSKLLNFFVASNKKALSLPRDADRKKYKYPVRQ
jgi:hypothetical protein